MIIWKEAERKRRKIVYVVSRNLPMEVRKLHNFTVDN